MVWMTTLRSAPATTRVDSRRAQGAQVPAELQDPGAGLARLDEPVELVLAQVAGGEQVPDPAVRVWVARIRGRGTRPGLRSPEVAMRQLLNAGGWRRAGR